MKPKSKSMKDFRAVCALGALSIVLLGPAGGGHTSAGAALPPLSACSLVTLTEARGLIGAGAALWKESDTEVIRGGQRFAQCTYSVPGQALTRNFDMFVTRPVSTSQFREGYRTHVSLGHGAHGVAGLGDEAYAWGTKDKATRMGAVTLLKRSYEIVIKVFLAGTEPAQIVDLIVPIARKAADRLQ